MDKQPEFVCNISKAGDNFFAKVPEKRKGEFFRGDKVKVTLLERNSAQLTRKTAKENLMKFMKNPNGEKMKGAIMGFPVEIPFAKLLEAMPKKKAQNLFLEALKVI